MVMALLETLYHLLCKPSMHFKQILSKLCDEIMRQNEKGTIFVNTY